MTVQLAVVMDPIAGINYKKDTTLAMLWAAKAKGWQLHYLQPSDLYLHNGQACAGAQALDVFENPEAFYQLGDSSDGPMSRFDVVLMRKDPPFDQEFLYATYLLELAEQQGCLVVNKAASLRDCNEKLFASQFPQCIPEQIVSRDPARLREFHQRWGDVIIKPLDGMGGTSIFRVKEGDANLGVIIETVTEQGQSTVMAQRFIPEIKTGDKRILMVDGEVMPYCLARIPAKGENRGNLAAGGSGVVQPISERDRWIAEQVAPVAKEKGLLFIGLDVIGDYLTEINVTSPTCVREIEREHPLGIADKLMDAIAARL